MAARGSRSALPGRALAGGVRRSFRDSTSGVVASHGRCGSPEPRPHSCGAPTCRDPEARSLPPREGLGATSGSARASRPRGRPMSVLTRGFDRWSSSPRRCTPSWALRPWVSSPGRLHRLISISTPYEGTSFHLLSTSEYVPGVCRSTRSSARSPGPHPVSLHEAPSHEPPLAILRICGRRHLKFAGTLEQRKEFLRGFVHEISID